MAADGAGAVDAALMLESRTISTAGVVLNSYAQLVVGAAAGATTVQVDNTANMLPGTAVLLWQTTASVVPVSGDATPFAAAGSGAGRWEPARVASVDSVTGVVSLQQPLQGSFPAQQTQVVTVPEFAALTITSTGSVVPAAWDGARGGVVALRAETLALYGSISADVAGLRGGAVGASSGLVYGCSGLDEAAPSGAQKGEGLAVNRFGPSFTGRGNLLSGGGVCLNSGGGAGGNGGAGGGGGKTWSGVFTGDGGRAVGGAGGAAVSATEGQLILGGGGGSGQGNDGGHTAGARGGGVIAISAGALSGTGTIAADGGQAGMSNSDAAGGGGAGGTIYLDAASVMGSCPVLRARGGAGGNSPDISNLFEPGNHGPGGGGGGGRVLLSGAVAGCPVLVVGGAAGLCGGQDHGAGAGAAGVVQTIAPIF
jgi:hypothetical protein